MLCQSCGAENPEDQEFCGRCHQKLLVVSGTPAADDLTLDAEADEESFSFDEHLLERISILEEAVKQTAETVRQLLTALGTHERSILVQQTGLSTLRELLEEKSVVHRAEWQDRWESKMEHELLALEKRERFAEVRDRVVALFGGSKRELFGELVEDAEVALHAVDIDRALAALEAAFKLDRDNYELAHFLGETYFNEGDAATALAFFRRVLAVRPEHYEGLVYSGVLHHEHGDEERAEQLLRRAVELYPDHFLPLFSLGAVYAGRGQLARATTLLEQAVAIDGAAQARYLLGSCLYEMGRLQRAIGELQEVVRHDPAHEEAHYLLGLAYLDRHWNRKALASFRQAQRLNPSRLRYHDLVRTLSGQGGSPLPAVGSAASRWLERGEALRDDERPERSLSAFRRAVQEEPENPTLLLAYAMACMEAQRYQEGEQVSRRILELDPGPMLEATAYATLIEALRSSGQYREGARVGRQLLEEGESDYARTIAYYELAFNLAEMEEDLESALDYARSALEHAPDELRQFPLAAIGWVHYKRKEFDRAIHFLERSSELGASASTLTHLGMARLASGDEAGARAALAEARELDRSGPSLERRMMECLKTSDQLVARVRGGRRRS